MAYPIFLNISTANLPAASSFYDSIGFIKHPFFSSEHGHAMVHSLNHDIVVMLSTTDKFDTFLPAERRAAESTLSGAAKNAVIFGLTAKSKQQVDELIGKAVGAGAKAFPIVQPEECDPSMMYMRMFADLDGYLWEVIWCEEGMVKMAEEMLSKSIKELEEKQKGCA